jgi:formylglycine-generating enzyme required for sulfatase activity
MKVFCHTHESTFKLIRGQQIVCDLGSEVFADSLFKEDCWCFCCGCQTFWKFSEFKATERQGITLCVACGRQVVKSDNLKKSASPAFYLCHVCKTISFQTKDVARGAHCTLTTSGLPKFRCPGCDTAINHKTYQHDCTVLATLLMTTRQECFLCGEAFPNPLQKTVIILPKMIPAKSDAGSAKATGNYANQPVAKPASSWQGRSVVQSPTPSIAVATTMPKEPAPQQAHQATKHSLLRPAIKEIPSAKSATSSLSRLRSLVGAVIVIAFLFVCLRFFSNHKEQTVVEPIETAETKPASPTVQVPAGMIFIADGEFLMGSNDGDEFERPQHKVRIKNFFIDKHEVTCEQYLKFIEETGHRAPANWTGKRYPPYAARIPVTGVDWYDANAYSRWVGKRLPTEIEWEYAARGTDGRRYPWGNDWRKNAANADEGSPKKMTDVGSFSSGASPFGVLDLIGNAWEWTADSMKAYPGGNLPEKLGEDYKVIRGGSCNEDRQHGASATYRGYLPARDSKDYNFTGFRCVKDIP